MTNEHSQPELIIQPLVASGGRRSVCGRVDEGVDGEDQVGDFFFVDLLDLPSTSSASTLPSTSASTPSDSSTLLERSSAPNMRKKYTSRDSERFSSARSKSLCNVSSVPSVQVYDLVIRDFSPRNIDFSELKNMTQVHVGRVSIVYKAMYKSEVVGVKVMMSGLEKSDLIQAQFDMEQHVLSALEHPNIVRLVGTGHVDGSADIKGARRFTVLEWLDHSLDDFSAITSNGVGKAVQNVLSLSSLSSSAKAFSTVLPVLEQIGSVLRYLHGGINSCRLKNADTFGSLEIVHRSIVPEHFRYSGNPSTGVKLTSFMTCSLTWRNGSRGNVGADACVQRVCACPQPPVPPTLGYTPPEVALRLSHSAESDIYAFALLSWQLMKKRRPFAHISKSNFMSQVIYKGARPKISKSWCEEFRVMLESCWRHEPSQRPPMNVVCQQLADLSDNYRNMRRVI
jgi:hypothetical protein